MKSEETLSATTDTTGMQGRRVRLPRRMETCDGVTFDEGTVLYLGGDARPHPVLVSLLNEHGREVLRTFREGLILLPEDGGTVPPEVPSA